MSIATLELPVGYYLEWESDMLVLYRSDGYMVAAFSARGVTPAVIRRAAEDDARETSSGRVALRVRFFGIFEVTRNGEALSFARNTKALAILKYLLAHRDQPISRDNLMGWLWPESNLRKARWSLNSAVSALRRQLSDQAEFEAPTEYILLEEGRYRLCPAIKVSTDVDDFDAHCERGRRLERDQRALEAATEYEKAIALYRDDYLDCDLYEDWTFLERERLLHAYVEKLSRLAHFYEGAGKYREAIIACFGILEKDPFCEQAYRLLMRCYARLGFPALAVRQYELCERLISRRLGLEPSFETQAVYQKISAR